MELLAVDDKKIWNEFIRAAGELDPPAGGLRAGAEFLQSWEWGEILRGEGEEIRRVGIKNPDGRLIALSTLVKKNLGAGYFYWYAPRGPIVSRPASAAGSAAAGSTLEFLAAVLKKEDCRALFLRLEPAGGAGTGRLWKKTVDLQPQQTRVLDLSASAAELLAGMHQKTRYNLHLAEKKGVKIREGSLDEFPEFWRLLARTADRDKFRLHPAQHYKILLATAPEIIKLFLAEYEGRSIAAGIFSFWGGRATYLHGASDDAFRSVMAPYLLQWSAIGRAKDYLCGTYDFNGIDEKKWPGVTRFKAGFGGRVVTYPGTYDLVFRPAAYCFYNLIRAVRRKF